MYLFLHFSSNLTRFYKIPMIVKKKKIWPFSTDDLNSWIHGKQCVRLGVAGKMGRSKGLLQLTWSSSRGGEQNLYSPCDNSPALSWNWQCNSLSCTPNVSERRGSKSPLVGAAWLDERALSTEGSAQQPWNKGRFPWRQLQPFPLLRGVPLIQRQQCFCGARFSPEEFWEQLILRLGLEVLPLQWARTVSDRAWHRQLLS